MIHLVLGGARSGKSEVAERLAERLAQSTGSVRAMPPGLPPGLPTDGGSDAAAASAPVWGGGRSITYVATGTATDPDMAERIAAHRDRRPPHWVTVEASSGAVPAAVAGAEPGVVLVDSLGTWVASGADFSVDVDALCAAAAGRAGPVVIVSDEVGMGVHPETEVGRRFRDRLGEVNRAVGAAASEVLLVVAGRVVRLESIDL